MRLLSVPVIFVSCAQLKEPVQMLPPKPVPCVVEVAATPSPTPAQYGCELEVERLRGELREREFPTCPAYYDYGDDG